VNANAAARADAQAATVAHPSVPTFAESLAAPMQAQREVQQIVAGEVVEDK
jgi:hypothetical protein